MLKSLETSYDDDKATNENQQLSWDLYPSYDTTAAWSLLAFVTFPTALQASTPEDFAASVGPHFAYEITEQVVTKHHRTSTTL